MKWIVWICVLPICFLCIALVVPYLFVTALWNVCCEIIGLALKYIATSVEEEEKRV